MPVEGKAAIYYFVSIGILVRLDDVLVLWAGSAFWSSVYRSGVLTPIATHAGHFSRLILLCSELGSSVVRRFSAADRFFNRSVPTV